MIDKGEKLMLGEETDRREEKFPKSHALPYPQTI
jgi:hypothetical protein